MNGKFMEKYGEAWGEMNQDMKMMAIMSEIYDLRESIGPIKPFCEKVRKHDFQLTIIKWIGGIIVSGIILSLIALFFELIKNR